jgi:acyl-CoA dehydrogenase
MAFFQEAPKLANTFETDTLLQQVLERIAPEALSQERTNLSTLGELAAGELFELLMNDRDEDEPKLTKFDPWGRRVERIELTRLWKRAQPIATQYGLVGAGYDAKYGEFARVHQMALIHLFHASSGVATCPLAMTDGAAKTLRATGNQALIERAFARLTSRDPAVAWTSGQWMTERTGGSDVAISETIARPNDDGSFGLYGTKWFTSATTSQMALTLARPEGNPPGGSGLALFYVEQRLPDGSMNGIHVNRLKDKLGTRHVPTAELQLDGARAIPVNGTSDGIKNITPMLAITRTWNAGCAVSQMRRATDLAKAYARVRVAFGAPLMDKPLHQTTLAWMEAESSAAFLFAMRVAHVLGREEHKVATDTEKQFLRLATPILKLLTAKQGVAVASEALEAFGGAGYIEDTGLPHMLRDAQVLPIWEGTTNVLSLDLLRAIGKEGSLEPIAREVDRCAKLAHPSDAAAAKAARDAVAHASSWLQETFAHGPKLAESAARALALTVGRALEVALLVEHAAYQHAKGLPVTAGAAARTLVAAGIDVLPKTDVSADRELLAL